MAYMCFTKITRAHKASIRALASVRCWGIR